jgi:hypothetical protein
MFKPAVIGFHYLVQILNRTVLSFLWVLAFGFQLREGGPIGWCLSKRWMARQLGAEGGRSRTAAKIAASRENGRKGGRPRKAW